MVSISKNGTQRHLGYFTDEREAARAYDKAARKEHKHCAILNFQANGFKHQHAKDARSGSMHSKHMYS